MTDRSREWEEALARDLKGSGAEDLVWQSPEGIAVKALYTEQDLEGVETGTWPGLPPFLPS